MVNGWRVGQICLTERYTIIYAISSKRKKAFHHAVQKSLENFELLFLSYISNSLFLVATITTHYITI